MGNEGRVVRRDNGGIGRQLNDKDGIIEGRRGSQWSHLIVEIQWMGLLRFQIFTKVRLLFNSFRNLALILSADGLHLFIEVRTMTLIIYCS